MVPTLVYPRLRAEDDTRYGYRLLREGFTLPILTTGTEIRIDVDTDFLDATIYKVTYAIPTKEYTAESGEDFTQIVNIAADERMSDKGAKAWIAELEQQGWILDDHD